MNKLKKMDVIVDLVSLDDERDNESGTDPLIPGVNSPYVFNIEGIPQSMPRPTSIAWMSMGKMRKACFNKKAKDIVSFRNKCKLQLLSLFINKFPVIPLGGVAMTVSFYRKVPLRQRSKLGHDAANIKVPDTRKPDIDNLLKFVLDGLTGVVYRDDEQVVQLTVEKLMDTIPPHDGRTVVKCMPINPQQHFSLEMNL